MMTFLDRTLSWEAEIFLAVLAQAVFPVLKILEISKAVTARAYPLRLLSKTDRKSLSQPQKQPSQMVVSSLRLFKRAETEMEK